MPTLYVIPNWDWDFENSKSRTIERTTFFCVQNHFDGLKIRRLQSHRNALELYGAFHAICGIASKCWYRGVLLDLRNGPLGALDIAAKTGFNTKKIGDALIELQKPGIGLLNAYEIEFVNGQWQLPEPVAAWAVPQNTRRKLKAAELPPPPTADTRVRRDPQPTSPRAASAEDHSDSPLSAVDTRGPASPPEAAKAPEQKGREPKFPPAVPQGGHDSADLVQFDEAKQILNEIFGREKRKWSCEEDQLLADLCPLQRSDLLLARQWFRLPEDHPVFEQTKRKQELTTFLRDYNGENDKLRRFAPVFAALNGASAAKKKPPQWRELMRWHYDRADLELPDHFHELPDSEQSVYHRFYARFQEEHAAVV